MSWQLIDAIREEYKDIELECAYCRKKFIWSGGEQHYFKRHNLTHEPRRCKECRKLKQVDPALAERKKEYVK